MISRPGCLDENDALDFVAGRVEGGRASAIEEHIDGCAPCRWLLSAVARASSAGPADEPRPGSSTDRDDSAPEGTGSATRLLAPGEQLGRYTIGGLRGIGSMGVVYAAHDAELGRPVALKLLRSGALEIGRARLVREAQALARLSHPNVVAIYDVGIHGDKVFAAMELVEGAALDEWLHARRRTVAEIVEVMAGAGRGLAAAHAAGLIHRDVKPENILVGLDGRARMTDFGLVRVAAPDSPAGATPPDGDAAALEANELSRTGALLGTPAYMSPEQLSARPVGAASDQFSFAVTLHEALYGERPFAGKNLGELRDRMLAGAPELPRGAAVPARVRRALRRALEVDPRRRYPSMDALLAELVDDRGHRRAWLAGGAGALALGAIGFLAVARREVEAPCAGAAGRLVGVWDPVRRLAVASTFSARGEPGRDAFERVTQGLDAYTGAWVAMHTDACRASTVRGEQPAEVLTLRMACLGKDLELTRQLVDLFASPGFRSVSQAVDAVDALPPLAACADIAALSAVAPLPGDPVQRIRLASLEVHLAELKARWLVDDHASVRPGVPALIAEATAIGYPPATASVLLLAGDVEANFGDLRAAEDRLYEGLWAAEAAHDAEQVARAWTILMRVVGHDQRRFAEGDRLRRNAEQAVERATAISPAAGTSLRIGLLGEAAGLLFAEGNARAAITRAGEALALEAQHVGTDTVNAARLHHSLAVFKVFSGDPAGGWVEIQRALAIAQQRLGVGPRLVRFRGAAASILMAQGKLDDAIAELERTLAIAAQVFTTDSSDVAILLNMLATAYDAKGERDRAAPLFERALAILIKTRGEGSAEVSAALHALGVNAANRRQLSAAQSYFERALAISEKAEGPTHYHVSERLASLGMVLIDQGQEVRAQPYLERALSILEARRASGEGVYPAVLAGARFSLAQALWASPPERARAHALAISASDLLDPSSRDRRTRGVAQELARWLAEHRSQVR